MNSNQKKAAVMNLNSVNDPGLAETRQISVNNQRSKGLLRHLMVFERVISCLLLVAVFALVVLQVVTRYVFNSPLSWTEEAARLLMVWLTFIAAVYVAGQREHLTVDILPLIASPQLAKGIDIFAQVVTAVSSAVMAVAGVAMTWIVWGVNLPATALPTSLLYAAAMAGFSEYFSIPS